jgi:hypothetical protein
MILCVFLVFLTFCNKWFFVYYYFLFSIVHFMKKYFNNILKSILRTLCNYLKLIIISQWVSDWLLFNAKWAIILWFKNIKIYHDIIISMVSSFNHLKKNIEFFNFFQIFLLQNIKLPVQQFTYLQYYASIYFLVPLKQIIANLYTKSRTIKGRSRLILDFTYHFFQSRFMFMFTLTGASVSYGHIIPLVSVCSWINALLF